MQTLKDDTRKRLLAIAHKELVDKGFKNTSMRTIARLADISLGNVYNYFRNKDGMFRAVMHPLLTALDNYIKMHNAPGQLTINQFFMKEYQEKNMKDFLKIIHDFRPELKLLLFGAAGTLLENYREYLIERQADTGREYLELMKEKYPHLNIDVSDFFMHIICSGWMAVLSEIVSHEEMTDGQAERFLKEYITYGTAGWKELIQV